MKNGAFIFKVDCGEMDLQTALPELKKRREDFFHAGGFLFVSNFYFGFLVPLKTGLFLVYFGQANPTSNFGKQEVASYLTTSLPNCNVTEFVVENGKGGEKHSFAALSLSRVVVIFRKFGKVPSLAILVCGRDEFIQPSWFGATNKKEIPPMPPCLRSYLRTNVSKFGAKQQSWINQPTLEDLKPHVEVITKDLLASELASLSKRIESLEQAQATFASSKSESINEIPDFVPRAEIVENSVNDKREWFSVLRQVETLESELELRKSAYLRLCLHINRLKTCAPWLLSETPSVKAFFDNLQSNLSRGATSVVSPKQEVPRVGQLFLPAPIDKPVPDFKSQEPSFPVSAAASAPIEKSVEKAISETEKVSDFVSPVKKAPPAACERM